VRPTESDATIQTARLRSVNRFQKCFSKNANRPATCSYGQHAFMVENVRLQPSVGVSRLSDEIAAARQRFGSEP